MVRFACLCVVVSLCLSVLAAPAHAQDIDSSSPNALVERRVVHVLTPPPAELVASPPRSRRPALLLPLYVSFGALQGLDAHSTARALDGGAVEANPAMKGLANHGVAMLAAKTAGTAGVIYAGEQIWKRNKPAAIIFMIAANSAMAWVVQHNYRAVE